MTIPTNEGVATIREAADAALLAAVLVQISVTVNEYEVVSAKPVALQVMTPWVFKPVHPVTDPDPPEANVTDQLLNTQSF